MFALLQLFRTLILSCGVWLVCISAYAQTGTIRGRVRSTQGETLESVSLVLTGTPTTVQSGPDGAYEFSGVKAGTHRIRASRVGVKASEVAVTIRENETTTLDLTLTEENKDFKEVVVTGQFEPQSLQQSVYQVRTISLERIQARAATSLAGVLNTELGIRFSTDATLGTTDIQLMGMSGRNVKILLDGVPMIDRGDTRESLNQIDINTIARIEIVEGPMSVSYGSDALAGVINLITKKPGQEHLSVMARFQEETAGNEYEALTGKGNHTKSVSLAWQKKGWFVNAGGTQNTFGGWQGYSTIRTKDWHAKDQWLGNGTIGFTREKFQLRYRLDGLQEKIMALGRVNENTNEALDQNFISHRFLHQIQAEWKARDNFSLNTVAAYTDYSRRTQTTVLNLNTGRRTLSLGSGEQDISGFTNAMIRMTGPYKISSRASIQPGVEINQDNASGPRIDGSPSITDAAFYVSSELRPTSALIIRPGVRFIKNSVYDAPPVIPSINTKITLTPKLDLRMAYARGFRSPALRELYFKFFDASHSIEGNPDLKAEYSNSYNGSLTWGMVQRKDVYVSSVLNLFYNDFHNLITYATDPQNPTITRTVNIDRSKTAGLTLNTMIQWKALQGSVGYSYIGRFNQLSTSQDVPEFNWMSEINANLIYHIARIDTKVNLFYKYTGKRTAYQAGADQQVKLAETAAYQWMDVSLTKPLLRYLTIQGGVKNLFNITRLTNTVGDTGGAHSTSGPLPLSYGRSYFLGVIFNWSKN